MIRVFVWLLVAGLFLLVLNWLDGGNLTDPILWVLSLGNDGREPGILSSIGWGIALLVVLVVIPFSRMPWWQREQRRWLLVGELILVGPPRLSIHRDEAYELGIQRRLGLLLTLVGTLFFVSEILEMEVHTSLFGKLDAIQDRAYWIFTVLAGMAALGIIGFGLATPVLWSRPMTRIWSARVLVILCFVVFFAELYERELIHKVMVVSQDICSYRKGVASIWVTAGALLSFLIIGWVFAERGHPA